MTEEDFTQSEEIKQLFISETDEYIQVLNKTLVELEKDPGNEALLNDMFRVAHTIKSMAGTMGYNKLTAITHEMESLMQKLRDGKKEVTSEIIDLFLKCSDALEMLKNEAAGFQPAVVDIDGIVHELSMFMEDREPESGNSKAKDDTENMPGDEKIDDEVLSAEIDSADDLNVEFKGEEKKESEGSWTSGKSTETSMGKSKSVRVNIKQLDVLMNLVGELVINKAHITDIANQHVLQDMDDALKQFDRISFDLQEEVLRTRLVPITYIFNRYPRMVRDLARRTDKEVNFEIEGTDIEVDRILLDEINAPLVHILRNAVDHGIESSGEREKTGKSARGNIKLAAAREKGYIKITVEDDGKGIEADIIRDKAVEKNFITREQADKLSDKEAMMLICEAGFSTASEITDTSGRGVGMDTVKALVEKFSGKLEISTENKKGTVFNIHVPLSLAILNALLVKSGNETYAIPLKNISETVRVEDSDLKRISNREVIVVREDVIPLLRLSDVYQSRDNSILSDNPYAVLVEAQGKKFGLVVDALVGQREIVIKTLKGFIKKARGFSGATILGDGRVVLIVDVESLV
ncbi:MAG: chemotaxis protein CheA [Elusimicrobiota bacterium]